MLALRRVPSYNVRSKNRIEFGRGSCGTNGGRNFQTQIWSNGTFEKSTSMKGGKIRATSTDEDRVLEQTKENSTTSGVASSDEASPGSSSTAAQDTSADRRFFSILPPFFSRETYMEDLNRDGVSDLWCFVQPLKPPGQVDIRLRMTVARLSDGNLAVAGPLAPTQELLNMLKKIGGEVKHIFVPSIAPEHWLYGPQFADAFPTATLWFPDCFFQKFGIPGRNLLFRKFRQNNSCRFIGIDPLPEGVQACTISVPFFLEAALYFEHQKAVVLSDTGIFLSASDPEYASLSGRNKEIASKLGIYDRLGPITKAVFESFPKDGRRWVDEISEKWFDMELIFPAHGSAPVRNALSSFKDCFDFL